MASKRAGLLALAACLAACKGSDYWAGRLAANRLHQRAKEVRQCVDCLKSVPIEFGETYPVPMLDGKQGHFQVLYFPVKFSPSTCTMASPVFAGEFVLDEPAADRCVSLDTTTVEPLGRCMPPGLSMTKLARAEARLFESLDPAAALYFKGAPVGPQERKLLSGYVEAIQTLVTPAMLPYYYRQNPDFWEWLRKEGGRSIPKP
ncbi:MAG: hypothetical protein NTY77_12855 [Elusimicrobia bacterium]|nr:hypothetical protein [Elusimicrobiota bacterium]